jgi:flagellar motility protein MotE (MotC chaperone)
MSRWVRDFRLMPIVLGAICCLFALKTFGLFFDGGYTLGQRLGGGDGALVMTTVPAAQVAQMRSPAVPLEVAGAQPQSPKLSWMQEMFNYPGDITGSIATSKPAEKAAMDKAEAAAATAAATAKKEIVESPESKAAAGTVIPTEPPRSASPGERALLERLQERRQELDARARELDLRESLLKAAEKKLEGQGGADKAEDAKGEARGDGKADGKTGPMAQRKEDIENARFKSVVTMYEAMKPKDAAKIFDRLDIRVLLEVASQMKPQIMSAILAVMSPEAAERLTVELAAKSGSDRALNPSNLPKIDGRPTGG